MLINERWYNWVSKREKERTAGRTPLVLIAYADFTDYEKIICRKDNWKSVFMPIFHRPESVRESLQRLYPIRVATMHSRIITREDQLYLFAETRRLICAFN